MRGKDLLEGMSFVDDRFVEKADSAKLRKVRAAWMRWASLAACLCVLAVGAAAVWKMLPAASNDFEMAAADANQEIENEGLPENFDQESGGGSGSGNSSAWLYGCQYIRTDGGMAGSEYPHICVIRSRAELEAYYQENRAYYDLERREMVYSDSSIGFLDACNRYDEEFFRDRDLILVVVEEGSGSIRHEIASIQACDGGWLLTGRRIVPEVGTEDMAQWHILVEIPKDLIGEDEEIAVEFYDEAEE